jgi:hypothetical protein
MCKIKERLTTTERWTPRKGNNVMQRMSRWARDFISETASLRVHA